MFDEDETNDAHYNMLSIKLCVSKFFICLMKKRNKKFHFTTLTSKPSNLIIHY